QAMQDGLTLGALFNLNPALTRAQITRMLKEGLGDGARLEAQLGVRGRRKGHLEAVRDSATLLFTKDAVDASRADGAFAERMMLRTIYERPRRELRLGTVIYRNKQWFLCMQPLCDSVRLSADADVPFPFLPLEDSEDKKKVDFVVRHPLREEWVALRL